MKVRIHVKDWTGHEFDSFVNWDGSIKHNATKEFSSLEEAATLRHSYVQNDFGSLLVYFSPGCRIIEIFQIGNRYFIFRGATDSPMTRLEEIFEHL